VLAQRLESDWEDVLLSVVLLPLVIDDPKVLDLEGRVDHNGVYDLSVAISHDHVLRPFLGRPVIIAALSPSLVLLSLRLQRRMKLLHLLPSQSGNAVRSYHSFGSL